MHWITCGLIIIGFGAPSSIVGFPYGLGTQGVVVGIFMCIFATILNVFGSGLIIELASKYDHVKEFKDLGGISLGRNGELFGTIIQCGNFEKLNKNKVFLLCNY